MQSSLCHCKGDTRVCYITLCNIQCQLSQGLVFQYYHFEVEKLQPHCSSYPAVKPGMYCLSVSRVQLKNSLLADGIFPGKKRSANVLGPIARRNLPCSAKYLQSLLQKTRMVYWSQSRPLLSISSTVYQTLGRDRWLKKAQVCFICSQRRLWLLYVSHNLPQLRNGFVSIIGAVCVVSCKCNYLYTVLYCYRRVTYCIFKVIKFLKFSKLCLENFLWDHLCSCPLIISCYTL